MFGRGRAGGGTRGTGGARAGTPAARPEGPGARGITRRLFLGGSLKATLAASVASRLSLGALLGGQAGAGKPAAAARRYDGELIEESYDIAHRLRDGSLVIPSSLVPEGPLHDAIVLGGGVSGLMAAWELERGGLDDVLLYEKEDYIGGNARKGHANGTDYTCATWSCVRPKDPFMTRLLQDLEVIDGFAADGTPRIKPAYLGPGPEFNTLVDGTWYMEMQSYDPAGVKDDVAKMPIPAKDRKDLVAFYRE